MSFGSVDGPSGADTSSLLRFGLTGLKPIHVRETIRRWGLRFERVYTTFQPTDIPKSYPDYALLKIQGVFSNISIPEYFEKDKLIEYYVNKKVMAYENDKEFTEQVKKLKKAKGSISPLMDFVTFCKNRYQENIMELYNVNSINFYSSDLSFSVINDLSRSDNVYALFLNLLYDILYSYNIRLGLRAKSDSKYFDKVFSSMKTEIHEIIDVADRMCFHESCLRRLFTIWNAKNYDDLENVEYIYFKNIPQTDFTRIYQDLKIDIRSSRKEITLHKKYREDERMDIKLPVSTIQSKEFVKKLFVENSLRD